jgi:type III secretory pathway lipoprotein EscJ
LGLARVLPELSFEQIDVIVSERKRRLLWDMPVEMQERVIGAVFSAMSNAYILCLVAGCLVLMLIFRLTWRSTSNDKLWG